jgi:hypothetical protein
MVVGTGADRDATCRLGIESGGVIAEIATATEISIELPAVAATVITTAIGAGDRRS